jgi:hypothetical protein
VLRFTATKPEQNSERSIFTVKKIIFNAWLNNFVLSGERSKSYTTCWTRTKERKGRGRHHQTEQSLPQHVWSKTQPVAFFSSEQPIYCLQHATL